MGERELVLQNKPCVLTLRKKKRLLCHFQSNVFQLDVKKLNGFGVFLQRETTDPQKGHSNAITEGDVYEVFLTP